MQMELRAQREAGARQEEPHEHRNQDFPKGTRSLWDPHRAECCRGRRDVTNPWALNLCLRNPHRRDLGSLISQLWGLSYCSHGTVRFI